MTRKPSRMVAWRTLRVAVLEILESRQMLCAASPLGSGLNGLAAMVDAPVMGPWALLAPPASTRTSSTAPSLRAMALALPAAPGQANGTSIFGGGIYGTAATSYSTRADGLPLLNSKPGSPHQIGNATLFNYAAYEVIRNDQTP